MLIKESWINVADGTNIRWLKIFHLYKGFFRKKTTYGFFVKGSAQVVEPPRYEYKGFKYKYSIKGDINRLLVTRVNKTVLVEDGSSKKLDNNSGIVIKKKYNLRSKFMYGPIIKNIYRKKIINLFNYSF